MALRTLLDPTVMIGTTVSDRPASPANDAFFFDEQTGQIQFFNGTAWSAKDQFIAKTVNEIVNTSAALQNDDVLVLPVAAPAKYVLDAMIVYNSNTTADFKCAWVGPTGSSLTWSTYGLGTAATTVNGSLTVGANAIADAGVLAVGGVGANALFRVVGYLVTANTTGTLQFRWAQNTSDVSDTTVIADSWMRLQRVG